MGLADLTVQVIVFRVFALMILVGIHGGIIAWTAVRLGDPGPRYDGRLTVVPTSHLDLLGAVCLILFGLGWSRPVAVDAQKLRFGRAGVGLIILMGALSLLTTAAILGALIQPAITSLSLTSGLATAAFLRAASDLAIAFALLSLLPIPPLAGGLLLDAFGVRLTSSVQLILTAALVVVIAMGTTIRIIDPVAAVLAPIILGT